MEPIRDVFDELGEQQKERMAKNAALECNILVSRIITYDFDTVQVSQKSKKINEAIFAEALKNNPDFDQFEAPVGVELYNAGTEPMTLIAPSYEQNAEGFWIGHDEEVVLQEDDKIALPMKYAILNLMKMNPTGLEVKNGRFVKMSNSVDLGNDIDAIMNNYIFQLQEEGPYAWQKDRREYWKMILAHIIGPNGDYMGMSIAEEEYQKRFGYLLNAIKYEDEDIKVKDVTSTAMEKFVANILYS